MPSTDSYFEREIEKAKQETLQALVSVALGDSHKSAMLQGRHAALDDALKLFRKASRADLEEVA